MNHKKLQEITSFTPPSGFKSYRPKKKQFPYLLFILALFLVTLLIHSFVEPAKAQAMQETSAQNCMTNKCVCDFLGEYVNGGEFEELCKQYD